MNQLRLFAKVVRDGASLSKGMPRFANFSEVQLDQLWSYVSDRARAEDRIIFLSIGSSRWAARSPTIVSWAAP